jgi:hypothetical protein
MTHETGADYRAAPNQVAKPSQSLSIHLQREEGLNKWPNRHGVEKVRHMCCVMT